jgi:hypothetical protein
MATITASEAMVRISGWARTTSLQRRHRDARGGLPPAALREAARVGLTSRAPKRDSSAGSSVSEASIVKSTAMTEPIASPYMKLTPVTNIPSSAMITVVPASKTALPEVSIASSTDSPTSPRRL